MIPAWAKVGAKVVAIKNKTTSAWRKGDVFTISAIVDEAGCNVDGEISKYGFLFHEISTRDGYACFCPLSFRPVQTKTIEHDMEMFTPLLNTKDEKELIDG